MIAYVENSEFVEAPYESTDCTYQEKSIIQVTTSPSCSYTGLLTLLYAPVFIDGPCLSKSRELTTHAKLISAVRKIK